MDTKTHYRKVFKSDHLGVADLEDLIEEKKKLVFTIKEVRQEIGVKVAGHKGNHNIAYFKESIKPLVLNATNSRIVKAFNHGSPFVEDWTNTIIELYIDANVKMKGEITGGVRIRTVQPVTTKPELTPNHERWTEIVEKVKSGVTIDKVKQHYTISEDSKTKLMEAAI